MASRQRTLLVLFIIYVMTFPFSAQCLSPKSSAKFTNLESFEQFLRTSRFSPVSIGRQEGDGIYSGGLTLEPEMDMKKASGIIFLKGPSPDRFGSPSFFIKIGEYAILDLSLKPFLDPSLYDKCLFLDTVYDQFHEVELLNHCLPFLVQIYLSREQIRGKQVLELGGAKGIASLFALKVGAGKVVSVDKDQSGEKEYRQMAKLNGMSDQARFVGKDFYDPELPRLLENEGLFEVIMANIGPHMIYGTSNLQAIQILNQIPLSPDFFYIGAGFSYYLSGGFSHPAAEGVYYPKKELDALSAMGKVTFTGNTYYLTHEYPSMTDRISIYQSFSARIQRDNPGPSLDVLFWIKHDLLMLLRAAA